MTQLADYKEESLLNNLLVRFKEDVVYVSKGPNTNTRKRSIVKPQRSESGEQETER